MARTAESELSLIISAKNRASRVVSQVKKDVADASRSMTASLKGAGTGWGALAGGIDKTGGLLKALVPEIGLPVALLGMGLKTVGLVAAKAGSMLVGSLRTGAHWLGNLAKAAYALPSRIMRNLGVMQWAASSVVRFLRNVVLAAGAATGIGVSLGVGTSAAGSRRERTKRHISTPMVTR